MISFKLTCDIDLTMAKANSIFGPPLIIGNSWVHSLRVHPSCMIIQFNVSKAAQRLNKYDAKHTYVGVWLALPLSAEF